MGYTGLMSNRRKPTCNPRGTVMTPPTAFSRSNTTATQTATAHCAGAGSGRPLPAARAAAPSRPRPAAELPADGHRRRADALGGRSRRRRGLGPRWSSPRPRTGSSGRRRTATTTGGPWSTMRCGCSRRGTCCGSRAGRSPRPTPYRSCPASTSSRPTSRYGSAGQYDAWLRSGRELHDAGVVVLNAVRGPQRRRAPRIGRPSRRGVRELPFPLLVPAGRGGGSGGIEPAARAVAARAARQIRSGGKPAPEATAFGLAR